VSKPLIFLLGLLRNVITIAYAEQTFHSVDV